MVTVQELELVTLKELKNELSKGKEKAGWKIDGFQVRLLDSHINAVKYHSRDIFEGAATYEAIKEVEHIINSCEGTTPKVEDEKIVRLVFTHALKCTLESGKSIFSRSTSVTTNMYEDSLRAVYVNVYGFIGQKKWYRDLC
mgnify:CR=1 FL=1